MTVRWSGQRELAHPDCVAFGERVLRMAANMSVPLHIRAIFDCTVEIVHSQWGESLDAMDWWVIGHLGEQAAALGGYRVRWGGAVQCPAWWEVDADECYEYVDTSGCCKPRYIARSCEVVSRPR